MALMIATQFSRPTYFTLIAARRFANAVVAVLVLMISLGIASGQAAPEPNPGEGQARVIDGVTNGTVFGIRESIRITGTVKDGAIAFGGDVIVEGTVDGDVAAIGGSVIQREGSCISGDVMVVGGIYRHAKEANRCDPKSVTMYAGYETELRRVMREPFSLLQPRFTAAFFGLRLLAILFWFVISVAVTAAMPNTVSRAITRLQLASLRVALISLVGTVVITTGVFLCLWWLPTAVSVLIFILALLLVIVATLFGRVVVFAATGHWLHRRFFSSRTPPESVKLLLGVTLWIILSSLPYVWPVVDAGLVVVGLGLALTARYRLGWKKAEAF